MSMRPLNGERVALVGRALDLRVGELQQKIGKAGGVITTDPQEATVVLTNDPNDSARLAIYRSRGCPVLRQGLFNAWCIGSRTRGEAISAATAERSGPFADIYLAFAFVPREGVDRAWLENRTWVLGGTPLRRLTHPKVRRGGKFLLVKDPGALPNRTTDVAEGHGMPTMTVDGFLRMARASQSSVPIPPSHDDITITPPFRIAHTFIAPDDPFMPAF